MSRAPLKRIGIIALFCTPTLVDAFEMATTLRNLCNDNTNRAVILPGVYDSLSAKIFTDSGAEVIFLRSVK